MQRPLMKNLFLLLMLAAAMLFALPLSAGKAPKKNDGLSRTYGRITITVRQIVPKGQISGRLPDESKVPDMAKEFFQALNELPEEFIYRTGIKTVTFLEDLKLNGADAGGVAGGGMIWLRPQAPRHTIYHEIFHIFDPDRNDKSWTKLNNRRFIYTGSDFYAADLSRSKTRKMNKNVEEHRFDYDFVSRYAMSDEREDRAETFAAMVVEGPNFLRRAAASSVMKKKMEYIIDVTGKRNLLGRDYWRQHLGL